MFGCVSVAACSCIANQIGERNTFVGQTRIIKHTSQRRIHRHRHYGQGLLSYKTFSNLFHEPALTTSSEIRSSSFCIHLRGYFILFPRLVSRSFHIVQLCVYLPPMRELIALSRIIPAANERATPRNSPSRAGSVRARVFLTRVNQIASCVRREA